MTKKDTEPNEMTNAEFLEKIKQEYDDLYEGHDKLSYEWAKLKKENRELNKKYNELLEDFNRNNSEPVVDQGGK